MLTMAIRRFLERWKEGADAPQSSFSREDLAAAALLVECARVDRDHSDVELKAIVELVRERCGLDRETAECLVGIATKKHDEVWHNWLFTSTVKEAYDEEGRRGLIEHLWEIAAADGAFHDFEVRLIERVARELEVSEEFVSQSRARAASRAGLAEGNV